MLNRSSFISLHLAVVLLGLSGLFGKILFLPAAFIVFARAGIGAVAIGLARKARGESIMIARDDFGLFSLLGVLLAAHWTSFFYSIQISSVAIGLLSYASFPIFVTFPEPIWFREKLTWRSFATTLTVCAGLILVVPNYTFADRSTQGFLWGVLSGFTFALLSLLNRAGAKSYSPDLAAFWQNGIASLVLAPFIVFIWPDLTTRDIALLMVLGVICTGLAHTLFISALKCITARAASVAAALESVYGIGFAYLFLDELPTSRMILGGLLIVGANVFSNSAQPPPNNVELPCQEK